MRWLNIGDYARLKGHLGAWDTVRQCHELEEEPLLDDLESQVAHGGLIVDHHVTDFFPKRYFDVVIVLRATNTNLYDRLKARGYPESKIRENVDSEIFQTVLDEAKDSYPQEIVHELLSDTKTQLENNVKRIKQWFLNWKNDNAVPSKKS